MAADTRHSGSRDGTPLLDHARTRCRDHGVAVQVAEALRCLMRELAAEGLDAVDQRIVGEQAGFRVFELAAARSRLRRLQVLRAG